MNRRGYIALIFHLLTFLFYRFWQFCSFLLLHLPLFQVVEVVVLERHPSLHARELPPHRQTSHHSTDTLTTHICLRLRFDLFSQVLKVLLRLLPSAFLLSHDLH